MFDGEHIRGMTDVVVEDSIVVIAALTGTVLDPGDVTEIDTVTDPAQAPAFAEARIAEGPDEQRWCPALVGHGGDRPAHGRVDQVERGAVVEVGALHTGTVAVLRYVGHWRSPVCARGPGERAACPGGMPVSGSGLCRR
ncbi:hypothetical protein ACZ91_27790 [Streptomyces regensis]|nr:hypothetical protein ACZ91_27790 [Streptomyces regensis]